MFFLNRMLHFSAHRMVTFFLWHFYAHIGKLSMASPNHSRAVRAGKRSNVAIPGGGFWGFLRGTQIRNLSKKTVDCTLP